MTNINTNSRRKILSINNYNYRRGGSDAVFIDHDQMFSRNGWDTALFAMQHPDNIHSRWSEYFVNELEYGKSYGIHQKILLASKVIYSWEARQKLSRLLKHFNPDVAHIHCIYHHLSPSILSLLHDEGIPCIMTAHDLKIACPAYKMLNSNGICEKCKHGNFFHLVNNRCIHESFAVSALVTFESAFHKLSGLYRNNLDVIVTPSLFFREKLIEWGWNDSKLVYIPNFIDSKAITPKFDAGKYFLYFGRLAPEKGIDTLIQAAGNTQVNLKIVGTGPYDNHLRSIAAKYENISFTGYKSGKDLWDLIYNARAIVLPSEWYENAPISILEAYAGGKPVIGADIGGIPEMLQDGITGYVFESGNIDDLSDRLIKIHTTSDLKVSSFGKNARNFVSRTYTPERYYNDMTELYSTLGVRTN